MLKTSSIESIKLWKGRVKVDSDSKNKHDKRAELNGRGKIADNEVNGNEIKDNEVKEEKNYWKTSKSKKTVRFTDFFTFEVRLLFTKLRQIFVKAPILYNFNLDCHIWIKTGISEYAIDRIFSQLTLNNLTNDI